jgi:hypothetical protein
MDNYSFILKLTKSDVGGLDVRPLPNVQTENIKECGKVHIKSYYFGKNKKFIKYDFYSRDKFKTICGLQMYNKRCEQTALMLFDEKMPVDKFKKTLPKLVNKNNEKMLNEDSHYVTSNYCDYLLENEEDEIKRSMMIGMWPTMLLALIGIISMISFWIRKVINKQVERHAETTLEKEINDELFGGQTGKEPEFAIYDDLVRHIKFVTEGNAKALIICGPPGTSKTYMVRRTLHFGRLKPGSDYNIAKGSTLGLMETYTLFHTYRNQIVVLDDFDTPLQSPDMVNMLKAITDSYSRRILSLPREKIMSSGQDQRDNAVPEKFEFKGKLIIVTNLYKKDLDRALLSRAPAIEIKFDVQQTIKNIEKMMKYIHPSIPMEIKKEVFKYILELRRKDKNINVDFRGYSSAVEARYAVPESWKEMTKVIVNYQGK